MEKIQMIISEVAQEKEKIFEVSNLNCVKWIS